MEVNYNNEYYLKHLAGANTSAFEILSVISEFYKPSSIIDFGCGNGVWLKNAKEIFNSKLLGIDQHRFSDVDMLIDYNEYLSHNLENPLQINEKYDMAISLEVVEHISSKFEDVFIESICKHSDVILFSGAIPAQGGTGHVNEQNCSYWADKFAQYEYLAIDCIRPRIWNNEKVEIWYKNNTVLYTSKNKIEEINSKIYPCNYPLDIIHPKMLKRITERRARNG